MTKRSPQEIADFFGCYVAQDQAGSWFLYQDKPILINENVSFAFWALSEISILLNEKLIDVPANHHWRCLYEPQAKDPVDVFKDVQRRKETAPSHLGEVYAHKEYILFSENNPAELMKLVTEKLNDGWELYGSPFSEASADSREWYHYQAMVRGV